MRITARFALCPSLLALTLVTLACGPRDTVGTDKLEAITTGITLDSVLRVIGEGPFTSQASGGSFSLFHGYRSQQFRFEDGWFQVIWYREAAGAIDEEITDKRETPILIGPENTVIARGWKEFEVKAAELHIPSPYQELKPATAPQAAERS